MDKTKQTVFVVDDDEDLRKYLTKMLTLKDFNVETSATGEEALSKLEGGFLPTLMILDLKLPGIGGLNVLKEAKRIYPDLPVIILTAHKAAKHIVDAVKLGAADYIIKPFGSDELEVSVKNVMEKKSLIEEVTRLRQQIGETEELFITVSNEMSKIKETVEQISNTDATVLILGESGVGKEVLAKYVHMHSPRKDKPFLRINCAALPSELLESELFGFEKGAFTGAYKSKPGKFEQAYGGTILLDEIADMSLGLQAKVLQVLQDGSFARLGGQKEVRVDVRILAATNKNLEECMKMGTFRTDLYYRLNVIEIHIPPLRKRKEEIPILCDYFLKKYRKKYSSEVKPISKKLMDLFLQYDWPGNIRELENLIKRLVILGDETAIWSELSKRMSQSSGIDLRREIQRGELDLKKIKRYASLEAEREVILNVLQQTNWNQTRAAKILKISYKTLLYKMKHCGIRSMRESRSEPEDES